MTVENLNVGGRFGGKTNETERRAAIARRATVDADERKNRRTLEKDAVAGFGKDVLSQDAQDATKQAETPFGES